MKNITKKALGIAKTFLFPIAVYLVIWLISLAAGKTGYFSWNAFDLIFRGSISTAVIAFAIALPLMGGRWDFAVGIITVLASIVGSNLAVAWGLGPVGLLLLTVGVAVLLALVEGCLYIWMRVPTMIVSLGIVMMYEAVSGLVFDGGGAKLFMYDSLSILAKPPYCYIVLAVVLGAFYILTEKTTFGHHTRSLAANPALAVSFGINEKKNVMICYLVVGILLGVGGVLNASTMLVSPANNLSSTSVMFSSMGPVLVGLYLARFSSLSLGVYAGAIGMSALSYGMVVLGIDNSVQTIILGIFIVMFMAVTVNGGRLRRPSPKTGGLPAA